MMIKRAVDGLSSFYNDTPYQLRTANSTKKVKNQPMVRLQNEDSLDQYIAYLQRFACYLLRVYVAQKERESCEGSESESGDEGLIDDDGEAVADEVKEGEEEDETQEAVVDEVKEDEEGDETQEASDSRELNVMKDCYELTKFSLEQKQLLQDVLESLESREDEDTQV